MDCASNIPITIVNWFMATSFPRIRAGEISAMYMGERFDASPIATPPSIRQTTNIVKVLASAFPSEVTAKSIPAAISSRFRPKASLSAPATKAPARQPTSAQLFAQTTCASLVS